MSRNMKNYHQILMLNPQVKIQMSVIFFICIQDHLKLFSVPSTVETKLTRFWTSLYVEQTLFLSLPPAIVLFTIAPLFSHPSIICFNFFQNFSLLLNIDTSRLIFFNLGIQNMCKLVPFNTDQRSLLFSRKNNLVYFMNSSWQQLPFLLEQ